MGKTRGRGTRRATRQRWMRMTVIVMGLLVTVALVLETAPPTAVPVEDASTATAPPATAPR